jgi:hypothetical protein
MRRLFAPLEMPVNAPGMAAVWGLFRVALVVGSLTIFCPVHSFRSCQREPAHYRAETRQSSVSIPHSVVKSDFAGRQLPSGLFGANSAWALMILALNLKAAMKPLVLGKGWVTKRTKALRFHLIGLPGRVVSHARQLIIRLGVGAEALATFITFGQMIRGLACGPAG